MPRRAAIFIGVDRCGDLPELQAAATGARKMVRWARAQGLDAEMIETLTDEGGQPVTADDVKAAVNRFAERGDVGQLLVYFAGHGINVNYSEYWLLSDAVGDSNEAVNVRGSEVRARHGSIPHVVFFSDACRSAALGVRQLGVTGSEIFRNPPGGSGSRAIDQFYGTLLGRPAHEIRIDTDQASRDYRALYTDALLHVLSGEEPAALEPADDQNGLVRPWKLKEFVAERMLDQLIDAGLDLELVQEPDAVITSDPTTAWVARIPLEPPGRGGPAAPRSSLGAPPPDSPEATRTGRLRQASHQGLDRLLNDGARAQATAGPTEERAFAAAVRRETDRTGRTRFETGCGFVVQGARLARAVAARSGADLLDEAQIRIHPGAGPDEAALVFADGTAAVLPVIPDFIGRLTFEQGELASVFYEPSEGTGRWDEYRRHRDELAELRALVAESARFGVFRLQGRNARRMADRIRVAKGYDPTMALYAAYAYHELHRLDLLADMARILEMDLGFALFDLALLSGKLGGDRQIRVQPSLPLLSQGWALLGAYGIRLPDGLERLSEHLLSSLWTLLDPRGAELVVDGIERRKADR